MILDEFWSLCPHKAGVMRRGKIVKYKGSTFAGWIPWAVFTLDDANLTRLRLTAHRWRFEFDFLGAFDRRRGNRLSGQNTRGVTLKPLTGGKRGNFRGSRLSITKIPIHPRHGRESSTSIPLVLPATRIVIPSRVKV